MRYVKKFYAEPDQPSSFSIDRRFIAKLWRWLSQHNDISVGNDHEYDDLTLDEIEAQYPGILVDSDIASVQFTHEVGSISSSQQLIVPQAEDGPRIRVSEELIYYAIAGHGPDPTRVFPSEYELLCGIAAARYDGILQGELRRLTGQDKRSVPKRTDALHEKGYIVKRTVWTGGHKTSRLFLRRFAEPLATSDYGQRKIFRLKDLSLQMFSALRESSLITQEDLGSVLGMTHPAKGRVLARVLRHFVRKSCLKKIKAAFGPGSKSTDLKICFQIVREPAETDWIKDDVVNLDLESSVDDAVAAAKQDDDPQDETLPNVQQDEEEVQVSLRTPIPTHRPLWNPDRALPNVFFDLASTAGDAGITNVGARQELTGLSVRRPLESLLVRLSHLALRSQPPAVRDIAIVRTSELKDGVSHYVHRTFGTYHDMVKRSEAEWQSLEGGKDFAKQLEQIPGGDPSQLIRRDEYGFVERLQPKEQIRNGETHIEELVKMNSAATLMVRGGELVLSDNPSGQSYLSTTPYGPGERAVRAQDAASPRTKAKAPLNVKKKDGRGGARGVNRKFVEGTWDFWHEMFFLAKLQQDPTFPKKGTGYMKDPAGLEMFKNRPPEMDECILTSVEKRLPLPLQLQDINQEWIDKMKAFSNRADPGLYMTPSGMRGYKRPPIKSRIMVLRSDRLKDLDFSERRNPPVVFFYSSSVAHTQRHYRFARWWNTISKQRLAEIALPTERLESPPRGCLRKDSPLLPESSQPKEIHSGPIPTRGTFYEHFDGSTRQTALSRSDMSPDPLTMFDSRHVGSDTDATATDPEVPQREAKAMRQKRKLHQASKARKPGNFETRSVARTGPSTGRGGRRRKPTQKIIESAQDFAQQQDSPSTPTSVDSSIGFTTRFETPVVAVPHHAAMPTPEPEPEPGDANVPTVTTGSAQPEFVDMGTKDYLKSQGDHMALAHSALMHNVSSKEHSFAINLRTASATHSHGILETAPTADDDSVTAAVNTSHSDPEIEIVETSAALPSMIVNNSEQRQDAAIYVSATSTAPVFVSNMPQTKNFVAPVVESLVIQTNSAVSKDKSATGSAVAGHQDGEVSTEVAQPAEAENNVTAVAKQTTTPPARGHDLSTGIGAQVGTNAGSGEEVQRTSATPLATRKAPKFLESRYSTKWYRRFLMELVRMCDGVVPDNPSTMKRAMQPKCIEANVEASPNIKNTKSQLEALVRNGELKEMWFAYQRNGITYKKKLLALPHVQPTDAHFLAMTKKVSAIPFEDDYVPPELEAESVRKPSVIIRRDETPDSDSDGPTAMAPKRKKKQSAPRTRRESSAASSVRRPSLTPEPQILSPNNGFLTLKVPKHKLETLRLPTIFTTNYFRLPAVPIQFETDATRTTSATAAPTPLSERRSGLRISRNSKFNSAIGKVQWRTPKLTPLPRTLKAIVSQDRRKQDAEAALSESPALCKFETEVDFVSIWEQRKWSDLQEPKPGEWIFINHQISKKEFPRVVVDDDLVFVVIEFNDKGEELEVIPPEPVSWKVFADVLATATTKKQRAAESLARRKRKFVELDGKDDDNDVSDYEDATLKSKRARRLKEPSKRKAGTDLDPRRRKKVRMETRGIGMRHLSPEQAHKLSVAIALSKVLAGGLERHLDLNLVARLFTEEPLTLIRERWKVINTRYMSDIDALSRDFQFKYLDALADGKVPSVNFNDLEGTDWEGIHEWAMANVNKESSKDVILEIPPTRDELLTLNELEVEESAPIRNLYVHSLVYTQPVREEAWCSVVFGDILSASTKYAPGHIKPRFLNEEDDHDLTLSRARSWILAAVLTPNSSFDPAKAHEKLLKLAKTKQECDRLLETTLKKLQNDKIIVKNSNTDAEVTVDGRTYSGTHGWKVSSKFFDRLDSQRNVSPAMLKKAAKYKFEVLDSAFSRNEVVSIPKDANMHDGEMVAVLNLLSMGMIQTKPGSDVPASRYGLDWERQEYKTKSMDKNLLSFTTILEPTAEYVYNDPFLSERRIVPVPRSGIDQEDGLGLIPPWFDINHEFRPEIWEMVLGAVVGLVSVRPGVSSTEVMRSLGWVLLLRDVEMIMQFLLDCQFVERTCTGWETTEWWWLAISNGHENGVEWNSQNNEW